MNIYSLKSAASSGETEAGDSPGSLPANGWTGDRCKRKAVTGTSLSPANLRRRLTALSNPQNWARTGA